MLNISTHPLHQLTNDIYKCRKQSISINDKLGEPAIFSNPTFSFWYRDFIERHSCDN